MGIVISNKKIESKPDNLLGGKLVKTTNFKTGQVLIYNAKSRQWEAGTIAGGSSDLTNYYTKTQVDNLIPSILNFKTINGETITGIGDITIIGGTGSTSNSYTPSGW